MKIQIFLILFSALLHYIGASCSIKQCVICDSNNMEKCILCETGFYLDTSGYICDNCEANCNVCANKTYCIECDSGYELRYNTTGQTCIVFYNSFINTLKEVINSKPIYQGGTVSFNNNDDEGFSDMPLWLRICLLIALIPLFFVSLICGFRQIKCCRQNICDKCAKCFRRSQVQHI